MKLPVAELAVDADSSPVVLEVNWLLGADDATDAGIVLFVTISNPGIKVLAPPEFVSAAAFRARDEERCL